MAATYGGGYIGQGANRPKKAITPTDAPGQAIHDLFRTRARSVQNSRDRIVYCRDLRRGLITVGVPEAWLENDPDLLEWVETILPERQSTVLNMANTLGAERPIISRFPSAQTDTAIRYADELEVWDNAVAAELIDWDEMVGKGTEDSEFGVLVMPSPAELEYAPDYMTTIDTEDAADAKQAGDSSEDMPMDAEDMADRKKPGDKGEDAPPKRTPNPKYDRMGKDGQRSERASIAAWKEDYNQHLAMRMPFSVRIVPATDCVPIMSRGRGKHRWECKGLVVRTLVEREELLSAKFNLRWKGWDAAITPRGFDANRISGQNGMLYLYEAFLTWVDPDTGGETPFIARCVGGKDTWSVGNGGEQDSATINLKEEYGICRLMAGYFWGLHASDDDLDYRGIPLLWPLANTILGKEGLLTAMKAHARDNAFAGNVASPDPNIPEGAYLNSDGTFKQFKKPGPNETVINPGPTAPWQQAQIGGDAWRLLDEHNRSLAMERPDDNQFGGGSGDPSGHALVVGHELLTAAKRQVKEGCREAYEFIIECINELACGMARGEWRMLGGHGVNVPVTHDIERTIQSGETKTVKGVIEFQEKWIGGNYRVTAKYPKVGNLAEQKMAFDDWQAGAGTFEEMRESRGDMSPATTRIQIKADKWFETPIGQLTLDTEVARQRGMLDLADKLQQQLDGELSKMGVPTSALAPEMQQAQGPPQGIQPSTPGAGMPNAPTGGSPTDLPDMGASVLGGTIAGQMGTASRQADASAAMQIRSNG